MPPTIPPPAVAGARQFWTRRQLALMLLCTEDTVSAMVKRGDLPRPLVLSRSKHVWPADEVLAALDKLRRGREGDHAA